MTATFHSWENGNQVTSAASFTISPPVTISAGDGVVLISSWDAASTTTPTVTVTGGVGSDTLTLVYGPFTSGVFKYGGWLLQSAGSGRTTVTIAWASSNPSFADASCWSFLGLTSPTLDGTGFATGSTAAVSSTDTATLLSAEEFAVGYAASTTNITSMDAPWTSDGIIPNTSSGCEHRILAATTAIHTNFTAATTTWITVCLTIMAAPVVATFTGYVFSVGQSPPAPTTKMIGY